MSAKKEVVNPKAVIHKRFGDKAHYNVEEIQEFSSNGCPGLAIRQKGPCLYRCTLQLPEYSVVSEIFKKKKDAMQNAAEKAMEKLSDPPVEDPSDQLVSRLSYLFSNEFYATCHPLSGHFRAALQREGPLNGFVPVSIMPFYDSKIFNLCKSIKPEVELKPLDVTSIIMEASGRLSATILCSKENFSLKRITPYPPEILQSVEVSSEQEIHVKVIRVPYMADKMVDSLTFDVSLNKYYMDAIAHELRVKDASSVLLSRGIGKASSETRLYFCDPKSYQVDLMSENEVKEGYKNDAFLNTRASYLCGQDIYGDAILATIGYSWKSFDLFHEDVSSRTYYRLLLNKIPTGIYKLSREAIFTAQLPPKFGTKSNWRGMFPRDILCTFCRQHHLPEPSFSNSTTKPEGSFNSHLKILSKDRNLIFHCHPNESHKKQSDAIQTTSLKALTWLSNYFINGVISNKGDFVFYPENFSLVGQIKGNCEKMLGGNGGNGGTMSECRIEMVESESEIPAVNGCLVCVSYCVWLVSGEEREILEKNEEFEFELGGESVIPEMESVVGQLSVGQSGFFKTELPSRELIFASNGDHVRISGLLSSGNCHLEYSTTLIRVTEPLEDRMEKALFSPSLSKQRVQYAVQHIEKSLATFLVDFGCGSGSLLDSLLDYPTSLERIIGVDISVKALARAAKTLHSKLSNNATVPVKSSNLKSALLLDGSITTFDSRLYGCDIGTCLEVIEHMPEDQATLFGEIVLSTFLPKILIVSTPNYEYNPILQKSTPQSQEEEEDKNPTKPCKFRNFDHKFEWTREQFQVWALELSRKHNYSVEFSGVGGVEGVEPGFASQIAVFKRIGELPEVKDLKDVPYNVVWDWGN